ncbi:MAG: glycoside hydrolase family 36 protein [Candidatus Binataceae bacterium]
MPIYRGFATLDEVNLAQIEIHYRDAKSVAHLLVIAHPAGAAEVSGNDGHAACTARFEYSDRGIVARARIVNRGEAPIKLDAAWFLVATGFDSVAPARFFKHGYQSWSASGAAAVGQTREHRYDKMSRVLRINHQSEAVRPVEAPEAATSELFTIVEGADGERVLAGFIDAASSLTTLTVLSPEAILARALLDGVELAPHATRELPPLYFTRSREPAARLAARWASKIGDAMNARTQAPFQRGWCSWYHYFHAIAEDALRANLRTLAAMRDQFPIEVVQLDDGFQAALGDWDRTNGKFPGGLKKIAAEIRGAGFAAGIWTAPFLAARDSELMRTHPDWLIRHESGEPLRASYNPNWTQDEDKFAYALDPSNPDFQRHLEALFRKLVDELGYSYLKLDFLYAAAAEGVRKDANLTRAETLSIGLRAIRAGAGDSAFILGCGCPLGQAIGIVDGMRIGPDVSPFWGGAGSGDPSTVHALDAIIARSFMHRRLWLNDPDCLMLRASETQLTADERGALASVIAGSGGMLLISDDMALLGEAESSLYREAAAVGAEMDQAAAEEPIVALDLMDNSAVRGLVGGSGESVLAMILNRGESQERFDLTRLGAGEFHVCALGGKEEDASGAIDLPPHSARIVRMNKR